MRVRCLVPYCGRTTKKIDYAEWICGDHWRQTSRVTRRALFRTRGKLRRYGDLPQLLRMERRFWEKLRVQAIERGMGI